MTKKEKDDFAKSVRCLDFLALGILVDVDAMNFGDAKTKAKVVRELTERIAKRYDKNGEVTFDSVMAVNEFFRNE